MLLLLSAASIALALPAVKQSIDNKVYYDCRYEEPTMSLPSLQHQ